MEQIEGKKQKKEVGEGIEELLIRLRNEKGWSRVELLSHLSNKTIKEKDIRKWELGLEYPDLDMIYELSGSVNMFLTKWICYLLNVSIKVGMVLLVLFYVIMLFLAFGTFAYIGTMVKK